MRHFYTCGFNRGYDCGYNCGYNDNETSQARLHGRAWQTSDTTITEQTHVRRSSCTVADSVCPHCISPHRIYPDRIYPNV
ncbi:hypothetical protein GCM10027093_22540 [Paraburkholderia jirisanensis]